MFGIKGLFLGDKRTYEWVSVLGLLEEEAAKAAAEVGLLGAVAWPPASNVRKLPPTALECLLQDQEMRERGETMLVNIVFDGPPGPESGRFVEVEDMDGAGVALGEWVQREDGYWVLRIDVVEDAVRRDGRDDAGRDGGQSFRCDGCKRLLEGGPLFAVEKLAEPKGLRLEEGLAFWQVCSWTCMGVLAGRYVRRPWP